MFKINNISKIIRSKKLILTIILFLGIYSTIDSRASSIDDISKEQYFTVSNNGSVLGTASLKEITRISLNSNVTDINAIAGELEYSVNGKDIFLRASSDKPVNFFIKLENGWTYKFILSVEDIPATQIFVRPSKGFAKNSAKNSSSKIQHKETTSPLLKKRISKILELTLKPKKYIGYDIKPENKQLKSPIENLEMKLVGIVSGDRLKAEKIFLTNKSQSQKKINLETFMKPENLAVYLTDHEVLPDRKSVLIIISEK